MYITKEYYRDDYKGVPVDDDDALERFISRASDKVDVITNYNIKDLESMAPHIINGVKRATAAQVELYAVSGGIENVGSVTSVKIGNFQYTEGQEQQQARSDISRDAIDYLRTTGLLYQGIGVVHHVY